jgi:hypothetical protein
MRHRHPIRRLLADSPGAAGGRSVARRRHQIRAAADRADGQRPDHAGNQNGVGASWECLPRQRRRVAAHAVGG